MTLTMSLRVSVADPEKKEGVGGELRLDWDRYTASGSRKKPPHPDTASWVLSEYYSC